MARVETFIWQVLGGPPLRCEISMIHRGWIASRCGSTAPRAAAVRNDMPVTCLQCLARRDSGWR